MSWRKVIILYLFLLTLIVCKKEEDTDLLFFVFLAELQDRPEKYDKDVQIITHTPISEYSPTYPISISYEVNYSDEDLNYFKDLLKTEIARYPRGYWIKAHTAKVVVCRNLKINGVSKGGMSAPDIDTIFLELPDDLANLASINPDADYNYRNIIIDSIHHELTHNVDFSIYSIRGLVYQDPYWNSLKPSSFEYGTYVTGSVPYPLNFPQGPWPNYRHFWNPIPGFVSDYATTSYAEDKAETGAGIMGNQFWEINEICRTDSFVAAKVNQMISEMNRFWPYEGAENTGWKRRISQMSCN
ncbi:hypothetical protein LEP1GSC013_4193 [Leptospira interrogans serovar Valbuzzi str. Duyster]|uniref:LIC13305 family lipoprotein n=1 Tax=Leptospira interrogans TaxID=173 RepID=UPI0002BA3B48|nr:hypothetical protein [Leptospira interrogans]EMJ53005.1 hypothetical protein LEP1GSC013_4193 [Leptospira interrogans serovar Valbuzzi str. Duyster]ENO70962.1 hypothetical protein LEP1GSC012_1311 [Leptospira interrogans serovar Valbuzzi str. Valbuzzi]